MRRAILTMLAVIIAAARAGAISQLIHDGFVPIGNPGNDTDTRVMSDGTSGYGSVAYEFEMGKYPVTNAQYVEFLVAVASQADPHGLYDDDMGFWGGIERTGDETNGYTYIIKEGMANRPVNVISWYDALRFTNWLTTGDTEQGIYAFTIENGETTGATVTMSRMEALALYGVAYFLPTEDEWYKAAYHDKNAGLSASYFDYPTGTNDTPGRDLEDQSGNNANYFADPPFPIDDPYYLTEVGQFGNSPSPYGTFDQGGNVWEWNEAEIVIEEDGQTFSYRGLRGGSYSMSAYAMAAWYRDSYEAPAFGYDDTGFRIGRVVPEPGGAAALLGMAAVGFLWWWRRR